MSKKQQKTKPTIEPISNQHNAENAAINTSVELKRSNDWLYYIGLAVVLILIYIIRKNFLNIPFERDEGSYMYSGKSILDGALPFKDIGSQRLDGVFYAYALLVKIFGYTVSSMQMGFILLNLGSTIMLFFLMRKLVNPFIGLATAVFFAINSMNPFACGFTIQSEQIVTFLISGGFLTLVYYFDQRKIWLLILSGILFSCAFEVKQTSAFYGMLAGLILIIKDLIEDRKNLKRILFSIFIFSMAVIIPVLIDLLVVYQRGVWADFKLWFFDVRKQYSSIFGIKEGIENFKGYFYGIYLDYEYFWIIAFIGTISIFFTKLPLWKKILISGSSVAGFLTTVPGYHFYGHYFIMWIPAIAITAASFIYSVMDFIERKSMNKLLAIGVSFALLLIPVFYHMNKLNEYYFSPDQEAIIRKVYSTNPFNESKVVADKLNTLMKKEDKLAVLGTEIEMYVYTNKVAPSRFAGCGALLEFPIKESKQWQQEFMHDIEKAAPKYLVFYNNPFSWMVNPKAENLIMPWFNIFVKEHYDLIGFADMLPGGCNYVWKPDPVLYNVGPKGKLQIFTFERKP